MINKELLDYMYSKKSEIQSAVDKSRVKNAKDKNECNENELALNMCQLFDWDDLIQKYIQT